MTLALIAVLAAYAVFLPALGYTLWRLTRPQHTRPVPVPGVLIDDTMLLTSDSDYVGLI